MTRFIVSFLGRIILIMVLVCLLQMNSVLGQDSVFHVHGKVMDKQNNPVVGVDIVLVQNNISTLTDKNGLFWLTINNMPEVKLEIHSVGFENSVCLLKPDTLKGPLEIILQARQNEIEEVKVKGSRKEYLQRNNSISIELIEEEFFKENQTGSLMQTLSKVPGVNSMDIGSGLSKPVIRGMGYYRVIVAQNGIRLEGQQWSNHHGLNMGQDNVTHVEVIKGPAALQYGSGAIGGVVNVLPQHVPLSQGVEGRVTLSGKSNNGYLGACGNLTTRVGDIYSNFSLSYSYFGDFRVPATDSFLFPSPVNSPEASHLVPLGQTITNTAGREGNSSLSLGIVKSWGASSIELSYYESLNGFFDWQGSKRDSLLKVQKKGTHDILCPYQSVSHLSVRHFTKAFFNKNKLEFAAAFQQNRSNEYSFLFDRTGNRKEDLYKYLEKGSLDLSLLLNTWNARISHTLNSLEKQQIVFGFNTIYQSHSIDGYGHILPAYTSAAFGMFATHKYTISDKWILNSGIRFDRNCFRMDETLNPDPEYGGSVFNPEYTGVFPGSSLMLGVNYLPSNKTIFKFNLGKSYRVPSAYELGAYGLHRHEGRFEKGDTSLCPETAWQLDFGYEKKYENLLFNVSPFLNQFTNYLYLNPTAEFWGDVLGQVYEYVQSKAVVTGGEMNIEWQVEPSLAIGLGAEYVYAVNMDLMSAVPFTPPPSITTEMKFSVHDKGCFMGNRLGLEFVKAFAQNYTVPNELQTPGYLIVNFFGKTEVRMAKQKLEVLVRGQNLLNARYYNHISFYRRLRIPEPGRNIQLVLTMAF